MPRNTIVAETAVMITQLQLMSISQHRTHDHGYPDLDSDVRQVRIEGRVATTLERIKFAVHLNNE